MKSELISQFLDTLKRQIRRKGHEGFTVSCNKCGSLKCQVSVLPDIWDEIQAASGDPDLKKSSVGIKCLDCGAATSVDYGVETIYG